MEKKVSSVQPVNIEKDSKSMVAYGPFIKFTLVVVMIFAIPLLFTTNVVALRIVRQESMVPTAVPGDYILVDKTPSVLKYIKRGDVVTFMMPTGIELIKRVIGLPGEEVGMSTSGAIMINGVTLNEPYISAKDATPFDATTVQEGYVFVMGDNRPVSQDSRKFGLVSISHITGRVFCVVWPLSHRKNIRSIDALTLPLNK